ncbi:hypothetical protein MJT46_003276, partial [Ovis ammon polii x Ovis aries]
AQATGSPHTSPTHGGGRPIPMPVRSTSAGSTPTHCPQDPLSGVSGDMQEAFAQGTRRNLRNDLLVAADSITNTMSSLVKELHSAGEGAEEEEEKMQNGKDRGAPPNDEPQGLDPVLQLPLHDLEGVVVTPWIAKLTSTLHSEAGLPRRGTPIDSQMCGPSLRTHPQPPKTGFLLSHHVRKCVLLYGTLYRLILAPKNNSSSLPVSILSKNHFPPPCFSGCVMVESLEAQPHRQPEAAVPQGFRSAPGSMSKL